MSTLHNFMDIAILESQRSIDPTRGVGALLFKNTNDNIVSTGYNTFPFWLDLSKLNTMQKEEKAVLATHAEIECLENTHNSLDLNNPSEYTMIITCAPCINCAMAIVNSKLNITRVVYRQQSLSSAFKLRFSIKESKQYLLDNNIKVEELCHTH